MDREITKYVVHPSHGAEVTFSHLSSYRARIFQERGPLDSLRQNPGENTAIVMLHRFLLRVVVKIGIINIYTRNFV